MSQVIDASADAASQVVQGLAQAFGGGGLRGAPIAEHPGTGGVDATDAAAASPVAYAEVVVTLPASVGQGLDPRAVDDVRAALVRAVEGAGAERAAAILLVNPNETTPRVTVLALVGWPFDSAFGVGAGVGAGAGLDDTIDDRVRGFVRTQPVAVTAVGHTPTMTLTPRSVTHRVDVLLERNDGEAGR